jgi:hypothetical protein
MRSEKLRLGLRGIAALLAFGAVSVAGAQEEVPHEALISKEVSCAAMNILRVGETAYEATLIPQISEGSDEVVLQSVINWGTKKDDSSTLSNAGNDFEIHRYDYEGVEPGVYTVSGTIMTIDENGDIFYVQPGEFCTKQVEVK